MEDFLEKHDLKMRVVLSKRTLPNNSSEKARKVYEVSIYKEGTYKHKKGNGSLNSSLAYDPARKLPLTIVRESSPKWIDIVNLLQLFPPVIFPPTAKNKEKLKDWNKVRSFFTANELRDIRALSLSIKDKVQNRKSLILRPHLPKDDQATVQMVTKMASEARSPVKSKVVEKKVTLSAQAQKYILYQNEIVSDQERAVESWLREHVDSAGSLARLTTSEESNLEGALPSGEKVRVDRRMIQSTLSEISHRTFQITLQSGKSSTQTKKYKRFNFDSPKDLTCYLTELVEKQKHRCALTGILMQPKSSTANENFQYSLDRIDSRGHYERGNLQMVCRFINRWKSDSDNLEFKRLIQAIKLEST